MKAVVFDRFGDPEEVLQVREVPEPQPGRGEVLVRMVASPINPSDLMTVRGEYGRKPQLPATPGYEGVGVVEKAGRGLLGYLVRGQRVAVLNAAGGNWAERVVIPARNAVRVSRDLTDEQVATFFVNPATAYIMTRSVLRVPRDAWLLQTAAGSALGRMVIRLGRRYGFKTINVVRRREQGEELLREGGNAVVCSADTSVADEVLKLTSGQGVRYALDAVGGATCAEVIRSLGAGGRLLIYGTLASEPTCLDQRLLIVGQKRVEGFWLSEWVRAHGPLALLRLFSKVGRLIHDGVLATQVGTTFPLDEVGAAVKMAATMGRHGKVLLRLG